MISLSKSDKAMDLRISGEAASSKRISLKIRAPFLETLRIVESPCPSQTVVVMEIKDLMMGVED